MLHLVAHHLLSDKSNDSHHLLMIAIRRRISHSISTDTAGSMRPHNVMWNQLGVSPLNHLHLIDKSITIDKVRGGRKRSSLYVVRKGGCHKHVIWLAGFKICSVGKIIVDLDNEPTSRVQDILSTLPSPSSLPIVSHFSFSVACEQSRRVTETMVIFK